MILLDSRILRFLIIRNRLGCYFFGILKFLFLYITYERICTLYLNPVFKFFKKYDFFAFIKPSKDITLRAALYSKIGPSCDGSNSLFIPFCRKLYVIRLCKCFICKITVFFHILKRNIEGIVSLFGDNIFLFSGSAV